MSSTTELTELHELIGSLRRCVTSLASKYGDSPATRRIVNDAERILNDIDRLDIDAEELELTRGVTRHSHSAEKITIPDTPYDTAFWADEGDRGVTG
ncbi:hypothetical protein ACGFK1_27715 [Mycobacterium sp. NPDC048908]|uniref:hypothetical protein n=1 Tax=Mycobacterium sp. NPDC048908 TaxID=3364292 RepID=UPI00371B6EE1